MTTAFKRIWWAAAAPPVLWMAQGALGWFIASHACPQSTQPMSVGAARLAIGLITLGALGVCVAGLIAAARVWRTEKLERVHFVAMLALVVCVTLTLGLCLAGLPAVMLQQCGETR